MLVPRARQRAIKFLEVEARLRLRWVGGAVVQVTKRIDRIAPRWRKWPDRSCFLGCSQVRAGKMVVAGHGCSTALRPAGVRVVPTRGD